MESISNALVSGQAGLGDEELTLNDHILTSLLVPLTLATDLVSEAVAFMSESLTVLTHWDMLHQLALDVEGQ